MTRCDDREKVSLTPSNWIGLIGLCVTLAATIGTPCLVLHGRVTRVEVNQDNMQRQMDASDKRNDSMRQEILDELRALRQEQKAK